MLELHAGAWPAMLLHWPLRDGQCGIVVGGIRYSAPVAQTPRL